MALVFPVLAAVAVGLASGGSLARLAHVRLRATWLFFAAVGVQVVAFPFGVLPWRTPEVLASLLWLVSYGLICAGAVVNIRITGVPIVAAGLVLNVAAVLANRGTMPVLPDAMHAAGRTDAAFNNSTALADPRLSPLVDRWAAPDWIPLANVFSVGDVVIAVGAAVIVLAGMGVRWPRVRAAGPASESSGDPPTDVVNG